MATVLKTYEVQCGSHKGVFDARGPGSAWRKLTKGKKEGFGVLTRFRELHPNGPSYKLGRGVWFYIDPNALEQMKP